VALALPSFPLTLALCQGCGHLHLPAVVPPEESYSNYHFHTAASPGLAESMESIVAELWRMVSGRPGDLVIDIGSNDGTWLSAFASRSAEVHGIEPAAHQVSAAQARGVETTHAYFTAELARALRGEGREPALVTANFVLANIPDLSDFFEGLRILCSPTSHVAVLTGYHPDQFAATMFDYAYHEHVSYFTVRDFHHLAVRHGFRVVQMRRVPLKGGSLLAVLSPAEVSPPPEHVQRLMQWEGWLAVRSETYFARLRSRIVAARDTTHGLLAGLGIASAGKAPGLLGYGLSHSVTTLAYELHLDGVLAGLVDDNPVRQGMFSPGLGLSIRPPTDLRDENHSACIVLAWQHDERILSRLQAMGWRGTAVIPMPDPRLVRIS